MPECSFLSGAILSDLGEGAECAVTAFRTCARGASGCCTVRKLFEANVRADADALRRDFIAFSDLLGRAGRRAVTLAPPGTARITADELSFVAALAAAQSGEVGVVRRDPMAMKPFCGYNYADYWSHWLSFGEQQPDQLPKVFHVNWFRKGPDGKFIWPGFSDNLRVLDWIIQRCEGKADAVETPIGHMPRAGSLNIDGLDLDKSDIDALLSVDNDEWAKELQDIGNYFESFGERLPPELRQLDSESKARVLAAGDIAAAAAFSPDGKRVALCRDPSAGPTAELVSVEDGAVVGRLGPGTVSMEAWHPSGRYLVVAHGGNGAGSTLWAVESVPPYRRHQLFALPEGELRGAAFSRDGRWAAAAVLEHGEPGVVFIDLSTTLFSGNQRALARSNP